MSPLGAFPYWPESLTATDSSALTQIFSFDYSEIVHTIIYVFVFLCDVWVFPIFFLINNNSELFSSC